MSRIPFLLVLSALLAAFLYGPMTAAAADSSRPVQLSLVPSIQLFSEETAIHGLRLAIVGRNSEFVGLDLGFGLLTTGNFTGVGWGLVNIVGGEVQGLQSGLFNRAGTITGIQWGLINFADTQFTGWQAGGLNMMQEGHAKGFLMGLVNVTEDMNGFQLGFVNVTNTMHGLQIGLVNIIKGKDSWPILPIVNWSF